MRLKGSALLTSPMFRRLFLPYFFVICCCVGVVGVLGARQLRSMHLTNIEQKLRDNSLLILRLLNETTRGAQAKPIVAQVNDLGSALACRITVIRPDGVVIADNEANPAKMENHRFRPEVIDALANGVGI